MNANIIRVLKTAIVYIKRHPQLLFSLLLIVIIPLAFLYSGQQFLEAGKANQERLQKDRIGLLHDIFVSLTEATQDISIIQTEIGRIATLNPDIVSFRLSVMERGEVIPLAALDTEVIGRPEKSIELYQNSAVRYDESVIFKTFRGEDRHWLSFRSIHSKDGNLYFIFTETSLATVDAVIKQNEYAAYKSLVFIYLFILMLAYWHIRNTDFQQLYKEAEKANETKDLFTNMIAHELRAPLTAIRGYASMLTENSTPTNKNKVYAERIQISSARLLSIITDLLDVARIQSGKLACTSERINVASVLEAVVAELSISAQEKDITLVCTGCDTEQVASVDPGRLQQVLTNIVSNSIKYTKEGDIELSIENLVHTLEIRIKDTGMGISADEQKKLFAPFYRVESNDLSTITGTGLGMWITKQLIELMGASIAVESIKGVGTHVVIKIQKK